MSNTVTVSHDGDVGLIRLDDGKANALGHDAIDALLAALDELDGEAGAIVLAGRPGRFSAGFDLAVMQSGIDEARGLLRRGVDLFLRLYEYPRPVVAACTGHALAGGAITLMSCDVRIGATGDVKIGLNEVAIGMSLPLFAVELARDRLSKRHFTAATNLAVLYDAEGATDVGYLDEAVEPDLVEATALERATTLAALSPAFAATRRTIRGGLADHIRATLDDDVARFTVDV